MSQSFRELPRFGKKLKANGWSNNYTAHTLIRALGEIDSRTKTHSVWALMLDFFLKILDFAKTNMARAVKPPKKLKKSDIKETTIRKFAIFQ
jgi:hypothetical protein